MTHGNLTRLRSIIVTGLTCYALSQAPAFAQAEVDARDAVGKSIPSEFQAAVTKAEFLGRQMFLHDRAAWLATEAMFADKRMGKLKDRLGGWVTEPTAHGVRVIFFSRDDAPVGLYEIEMDQSERLSDAKLESSDALTAEQLALVRARANASAQTFMHCSKTYNTVAMPSAEGLRVYLLPAFAKHKVFPVGGYHLYELDSAGEKILSSRSFSKGCIDLDESGESTPKDIPKGSKPVIAVFTHLLDPQPTEAHVFVSLYANTPMQIITVDNRLIWTVAKGRVHYAGSLDDKDRDKKR
jgi:hypothetical protein